MKKRCAGRGWRLSAAALGFAVLMVGSTAVASSVPEYFKNGNGIHITLESTGGSFESYNESAANSGWGTTLSMNQQWLGGGLLLALNDSSNSHLVNLWEILWNDTATPTTLVNVSGTVSDYKTKITWDNMAGAGSNAYGPVALFGGAGIPTGTITGSWSEVVTNFLVTTAADIDSGSSAWGGTAYASNFQNLTVSGTYASGSLNMDLQFGGTNSEVYHANGGAVAILSSITAQADISGSYTGNEVLMTSSGGVTGAATAARGGAVSLTGTNTTTTQTGLAATINGTFRDNAAVNMVSGGEAVGGAIMALDAVTLNVTGGTFSGNEAVALEEDNIGTITSTGGTAMGGAIFTRLSNGLGATSGTLSALRTVNTATDGTTNNVDIFASHSGVTYRDNAAMGDNAFGGALYINDTGVTSTNAVGVYIADTTFSKNFAETINGGATQGGAIWTNADLVMDGVTFTGNYLTDDSSDPTAAVANAIYLDGGATAYFVGNSKSTDNDGIAGTGDIIMEGSALELFGDYSNLAGSAILNAGTTFMNDKTDASALAVTVNNGAIFDLHGVAAGAVNSIAVDALVLNDGSTMAFTFTEDNNVNALVNGVVVTANATIEDGVTLKIKGLNSSMVGETYRAIEAAALTDNTTYTATDPWTGGTLMMSYTAEINGNNVDVTIDSMHEVTDYTVTPNQNALGGYLIRNNGAGTKLWDYIYNDAQSEYDLRRALDTSSGDAYASGMGALTQWDRRTNDMMVERMNVIFMSGTPNASASAGSTSAYGSYGYAPGNASGIWAQVDGYHYKSDRNANAGQGKTKGWGLALGYDKLVADWVFGIAFRYGDTRLDLDERLARIDTDSYSLSLYGGKRACAGPAVLHVMGGLTGAYHDNDGRRTQSFTGDTFNSDYHSTTLSAYIDAGLTFGDTSRLAIQPFGNVQWNGVWNSGFTESGPTASDRLNIGKDDKDWWSTSLGVRAMGRVSNNVAFDANAAWRHTYGNLSARTRNRFANAAIGDRFTVRGTPLERNEGIVGAGVTFNVSESVYVRAGYDYTFGSGRAQSHEGFLNIGVTF